MDLLVEADAQAKVQEAVFFACADLLNLEVDLLFFDTTSTYFERDEPETGEGAFRVFGHSKDHRPDLPQIVIGLAVTREGIPVRVWCWPGNTNDMSVITEVKDDLRGWRLGRVVTVVDRGFSSDENLRYLTRAGGHWIAGERMRDGSPDAQAALVAPGPLPDRPRQPARQGGPDRRRRRGQALRHLPQPRRGRARTQPTRRHDPPPRGRAQADRDPARQGQERHSTRERTPGPSARCATTPRSGATCARPRPDGCSSTEPRSRPRSAWTASSCSPPQTPTYPPRTSRSATRTCSKPNAASAT